MKSVCLCTGEKKRIYKVYRCLFEWVQSLITCTFLTLSSILRKRSVLNEHDCLYTTRIYSLRISEGTRGVYESPKSYSSNNHKITKYSDLPIPESLQVWRKTSTTVISKTESTFVTLLGRVPHLLHLMCRRIICLHTKRKGKVTVLPTRRSSFSSKDEYMG